MKKILLSLLISIFCININYSQVELWPEENASWYYFKYTHGIETFIKYTIDRDTTIQGKDCQVYAKQTHVVNFFSYTESEEFESVGKIIALEDSVLYNYNPAFAQFDTIVNFKANIGDSWSGYLTSYCFANGQDTNFVVTLTDKSVTNVEGVDLATYELTYSSQGLAQPYVYSFYQLIGALSQGELNEFDNCNFMEAQGTTTYCFLYNENENDEFIYHYNATISERGCDYVPSLGLNEQELSGISIINPIKGNSIQIINSSKHDIDQIELVNNLGQNINLEISSTGNQITAKFDNKLASGIYFCKITLLSGKEIERKLVVE